MPRIEEIIYSISQGLPSGPAFEAIAGIAALLLGLAAVVITILWVL